MKRTDKPAIGNSEADPTTNTQQPVENKEKKRYGAIQVVRQKILKLFTQHLLLVATTTYGLRTIESKQLSANYHLVTATNGVMDVSPPRLFYMNVSNFSLKKVRLLKYTVIAETTEQPTVIHALNTKPWSGSRLAINGKHKKVLPIFEENATCGISIADFNLTENRESQMTRSQLFQNDCSKSLFEDRCTTTLISEKYPQYRQVFLSMLFNIQLI